MPSSMLYKQCKLVKDNREYISFIPFCLAMVGMPLIIKVNNEAGWIVKEVYPQIMTQQQIDVIRTAQQERQKTLK